MGFGVSDDLQSIASTVPCLNDKLFDCQRIVCLSKLVSEFCYESKDFSTWFGTEKQSGVARNFSLKDLCREFLGLQLDKSEQLNVWTQRPLLPEMRNCAALDAVCQIMLLERLREMAREYKLDLAALMDRSCVRPSRKRKHDEKETEDAGKTKLEKRGRINSNHPVQALNQALARDSLSMDVEETESPKGSVGMRYKCVVRISGNGLPFLY